MLPQAFWGHHWRTHLQPHMQTFSFSFPEPSHLKLWFYVQGLTEVAALTVYNLILTWSSHLNYPPALPCCQSCSHFLFNMNLLNLNLNGFNWSVENLLPSFGPAAINSEPMHHSCYWTHTCQSGFMPVPLCGRSLLLPSPGIIPF